MRKKLRSQHGVAMVFAIVAVVVVMVMGVVIYTAGYANYSKLFGRKNERQTYYTLMSAAKYAGSQLDGATIKHTEIYDDVNKDSKYDLDTEENSEAENNLPAESYDWAQSVLEAASKGAVRYTLEFTLEDESEFAEFDVTIPKIELPKAPRKTDELSESDDSGATTDTKYAMTLSDGKNSVVVEFTIGLTDGDSYETTETDGVNRKTKDLSYTFRMGNIVSENGGSGT